jgi:dephospho-CoA kinase
MFIIGVTGSFGTGKTTVAKMFKELGAKLIDADEIAHKIIRPGTIAWKKAIASFGRCILLPQGIIDRKKLGSIVFKDKSSLDKLCRIIHPIVIEEIEKKVNQIKIDTPDSLVVIDAPLLIEAGLVDRIGVLIVVKANRETQIKRSINRTRLSRNQILQRIRMQMSLKDKEEKADYIIDNNGTLAQTKKRVKKIWKEVSSWKKKR